MTADFAHLEAHRPALMGHCYRMLGSAFDADDAVQETMIRAWRSFDQFDGRASVKTWLYRIATNVCLDELKNRARRARPMEEGAPSSGSPSMESLTQQPREYWIEPILDSRVLPAEADPSERAALRQSIRLAFVAALQNLTPKQRAALLMTEVLGCSAADVAETLETSIPSVNSALQRARATLAKQSVDEPAELTEEQQGMLSRYIAAFGELRCRWPDGLDATGRDLLHASVFDVAARTRRGSNVDARIGMRLPGFTVGSHLCLWLAGLRAVSAQS